MIEDYLKKHYSAETAKAYRREIEIFIGNYPDAATAVYKDVTGYIGALRGRYRKPATINRIVSSIKVYYDYLCEAGTRSDNPARAIHLKDQISRDIQLQDMFTMEELEQLLNRKERYAGLDYRNKVLTGLLIYQALLPQEIEALTVDNINLNDGTIHVKSTHKTNARTLQLKASQILLFHEYITGVRINLLGDNQSEALLIGIRGGAMRAEDITHHIKRSFTELYPGRKVNAQTIRQSVVANLLKQGHDISLVQAFAGHKYPSSTERYKQSDVETLKSAVHKYHPVK